MSNSQINLVTKELEKFGIKNISLEEFISDYNELIDKEFVYYIYRSNGRDDLIEELVVNPYVLNILDRIESTFLSCSQTLQCARTDRRNITFDNGKIYYYTPTTNFNQSGTFNEILIYSDDSTNRKYVIKQNKKYDLTAIRNPQVKRFLKTVYTIKAFYENLKHIILTILITNTYGEIKLMPKIYDIGYIQEQPELPRPGNIKAGVGGTICIVMEYAQVLTDSIGYGKKLNSQAKLNKFIYSVYKALELINSIQPLVHFRHGDLKFNNILISEDNKPIMIDFGFSEFELDSKLKFKSAGKILNYWNNYECFHPNFKIKLQQFGVIKYSKPLEKILDMLNSTNDIMFLLLSLKAQIGDAYAFILVYNPVNKYFISGASVKDIATSMFGVDATFSNFYNVNLIDNLEFYELIQADDLVPYINLSTTLPSDPDYISTNPSDLNDLFAKYNIKYFKYKEKYLKLKN
jgi:serine/threonine protein kinase